MRGWIYLTKSLPKYLIFLMDIDKICPEFSELLFMSDLTFWLMGDSFRNVNQNLAAYHRDARIWDLKWSQWSVLPSINWFQHSEQYIYVKFQTQIISNAALLLLCSMAIRISGSQKLKYKLLCPRLNALFCSAIFWKSKLFTWGNHPSGLTADSSYTFPCLCSLWMISSVRLDEVDAFPRINRV